MAASPTATRATVGAGVPAPAPTQAEGPTRPSIWRLPIELRWVALLVAAVIVPPALLLVALAPRVDRGPYGGPSPGEPAAPPPALPTPQRRAAEAVAGGNPAEALALLAGVLDQAPYSAVARSLRAQASASS